MATATAMKVVVTGGAGQIAYSLVPQICSGLVFGPDTMVDLRLLDIEPAREALEGVAMEIQDSAYENLSHVTVTTDAAEAFRGANVAVLLGGFPRKEGMERKDVMERNVGIMRVHGQALEQHADLNCKVVVVANPANTNCLVAIKYAPSLPRENFSALTRLDHDRLRGMLAAKITSNGVHRVTAKGVRNCIIWGNHSSTQVPDASHAEARVGGAWQPAAPLCNDDAWLQKDLMPAVQQRGAAVIAARKLSSAMSAANAVASHLRDWLGAGMADGGSTSMAVMSDDNTYGVPNGLMFSFPVMCGGGKWRIVPGLEISPSVRVLLDATTAELVAERDMAMHIASAANNAIVLRSSIPQKGNL